jgi:NADH-quinone oxidoreductase subunit E
MVRYDLRHLKENFFERMMELLNEEIKEGEVAIFMFEMGDFSPVTKSASLIKEAGYELLNSLRYNQVDWMIVVRKKEKA